MRPVTDGECHTATPDNFADQTSMRTDRRWNLVGNGNSWTVSGLREQLDLFDAELRAAGLAENTIRTYVDRSRYFVRWLDGDYRPGIQTI